jgi:C-terminal processing protease CtpA/Prc
MLSQLHDPHVHLVDGKRRFQVRRGDATPIGSVQEALIKYLDGPASPLVGGVRRLAYDRLAYGMTGEGIGYLSVMTMGGFAAGPVGWPGNTTAAADRAAALEALKSALGELSASRGLVLDLRYNPGGSEEIADLIAGCFADRRRLAYSRKARDGARYGPSFSTFAAPNDCPRFVKPIAVLVGERTTSAAEALVMRMRVLPQVVVIGQATQGAHSDVLDKTMPNGWKLGLSNEVYTLADGHVYEGVGIPPSVETPPTVKEDAEPVRFGRDIDIAVAILNKVAVN